SSPPRLQPVRSRRNNLHRQSRTYSRGARRARKEFLIVLCGLCVLCVSAYVTVAAKQAASVDPALYGALKWRSVGPFRAGRVNAVTGVAGQPNTFYFGSVGGGVWKSSNAGRTWAQIFDGNGVASVGAIAVAPSNPDVIYVGSGEADMRDSIQFGD